jgi:hypothetical protein
MILNRRLFIITVEELKDTFYRTGCVKAVFRDFEQHAC